MTKAQGLGFAADIRPMFRDSDIASMRQRHIDLSSYDDVSARADDILFRLNLGDMPCDQPWAPADIAKFQSWIDGGKLP